LGLGRLHGRQARAKPGRANLLHHQSSGAIRHQSRLGLL